MTTATVEREELQQIIKNLPDNRIPAALLLVKDFCIEGYEPNEETVKVLKDSQAGRNVIGPFRNMNDFMASLLSGGDA